MTTARILVTGSRDWTDSDTIERALSGALAELRHRGQVVLVHGACPTGADAIADAFWLRQGLPMQVHPADWNKHGRAAGPIRNQAMVDAGADIVLAFPKGASRGTRNCIRAAQKAGLDVRVHEHAG